MQRAAGGESRQRLVGAVPRALTPARPRALVRGADAYEAVDPAFLTRGRGAWSTCSSSAPTAGCAAASSTARAELLALLDRWERSPQSGRPGRRPAPRRRRRAGHCATRCPTARAGCSRASGAPISRAARRLTAGQRRYSASPAPCCCQIAPSYLGDRGFALVPGWRPGRSSCREPGGGRCIAWPVRPSARSVRSGPWPPRGRRPSNGRGSW